MASTEDIIAALAGAMNAVYASASSKSYSGTTMQSSLAEAVFAIDSNAAELSPDMPESESSFRTKDGKLQRVEAIEAAYLGDSGILADLQVIIAGL